MLGPSVVLCRVGFVARCSDLNLTDFYDVADNFLLSAVSTSFN